MASPELASPGASIKITGLEVRFGSVRALELPELTIASGERLVIRGANGSGKSTLLRVLAGLQPASAGTVVGTPPPGRTVLVHQQPYLFRGTVLENVAYALGLARRQPREAIMWLEAVGGQHLAGRRARELSVGERRRVALARALAVSPELLLLDEPFAGLDAAGLAAACEALRRFEGTLVIAAPGDDLGPCRKLIEREFELAPARG